MENERNCTPAITRQATTLSIIRSTVLAVLIACAMQVAHASPSLSLGIATALPGADGVMVTATSADNQQGYACHAFGTIQTAGPFGAFASEGGNRSGTSSLKLMTFSFSI
jgi:hypothetical protein